jgi:integrase/recombinase XerD
LEDTVMASLECDIDQYLRWMDVHNYAVTTMENRRRYLTYFADWARMNGVTCTHQVRLDDLVDYQNHVYAHRKRNGLPLTVATQIQRLVPVTQLFSWLRREHRIEANPAADLLMPRPDRKLPEATLSADEMSKLLGAPVVATPLGLRDRAVLEVFYSCALRRSELVALQVKDVDFERGTVFIRSGKGAKEGLSEILCNGVI